MSREIKFRGLDANGVMRYGQLSQDRPGSTVYYKEYSQRICWRTETGGDANIPVSNETLGQFTGLTTIDEKDIYEGDILEWKDYPLEETHRAEVYWNPRITGFDLTGVDNLHCVVDEYCPKIIGNVYENPELIKGGK